MSAQSLAKAAQGYVAKPVPSTCGACRHLVTPVKLPQWKQRRNSAAVAAGEKPRFTLERHGQPMTSRCTLGDFAVLKTATCNQFVPKAAA
jgi:hypothetical protein